MSITIADGIAAAKLAMDAGGKALDLLRNPKIDSDAVRTKVIEMQDHVFSAQRALGEAEEDNRQLRRQLDDRDTLKALEADMEFVQDGAFYVRKSERTQGMLNALCPVCWGDDHKPISMVPIAEGYYQCAKHHSMYQTLKYRQELERERHNLNTTPLRSNSWMR